MCLRGCWRVQMHVSHARNEAPSVWYEEGGEGGGGEFGRLLEKSTPLHHILKKSPCQVHKKYTNPTLWVHILYTQIQLFFYPAQQVTDSCIFITTLYSK